MESHDVQIVTITYIVLLIVLFSKYDMDMLKKL